MNNTQTEAQNAMGKFTQSFETIAWHDNAVVMIDQRVLPAEERYNTYRDVNGVIDAIRTMVIRGAPAIGCAAASVGAASVYAANANTNIIPIPAILFIPSSFRLQPAMPSPSARQRRVERGPVRLPVSAAR